MTPDGVGDFVADNGSGPQEDRLLIVTRPITDNVMECVEVMSIELDAWTVYSFGSIR